MPQTKLAHARGVDHIAAVREVVQPRGGGGVLPQARNVGNIVCQDLLLLDGGKQGVQQARFADPGLAGKDADALGQRLFPNSAMPSCVWLETISTR